MREGKHGGSSHQAMPLGPVQGSFMSGTPLIPISQQLGAIVAAVQEGPICEEDCKARQGVAFILLEKILSASSYAVNDYNYLIMWRMEQQSIEARNQVVETLTNRIHELEMLNADLNKQLEGVHELLSN
ncbi:hypothetical protein PIB30_014649 [Stylosanthes scabra]|uniref:Uncharacterized protein n=1 Tax=Stylosanthes scabra TaxID=79078 RepID=A0ABU6S6M9_9FABA|nr:hypothetical protein [Stylosanthes scabra]